MFILDSHKTYQLAQNNLCVHAFGSKFSIFFHETLKLLIFLVYQILLSSFNAYPLNLTRQ